MTILATFNDVKRF